VLHAVQVDVEGIRLHVEETGDGPPLLLINGIGAHAGMWKPLREALPGPRLIAFDAPGTGRSATPPIPLSMEALARVAEGVLDELGWSRPTCSATRSAARRATARAARAGARAAAGARRHDAGLGRRAGLAAHARADVDAAALLLALVLRVDRRRPDGRAPAPRRGVRPPPRRGPARQPADPLGYAWQLAALSTDFGSLPWLHRVTQPTLVVTGDDDPVMPLANALLLAHKLPDARLLVAPGEGHLLLLDPDSRALPAIHDFVCDGDRGDAVEVSQGDARRRAARHRRGAPAGADERGRARVLVVTFGVTSMTAPLRRVLVRRPATAGDWVGAGWRVPDAVALAAQHEAFCALLDSSARGRDRARARGPGRRRLHARPAADDRARRHPLRMRKPARGASRRTRARSSSGSACRCSAACPRAPSPTAATASGSTTS
jgi:pimeloyl-ACP methyl ester carboxylesterase